VETKRLDSLMRQVSTHFSTFLDTCPDRGTGLRSTRPTLVCWLPFLPGFVLRSCRVAHGIVDRACLRRAGTVKHCILDLIVERNLQARFVRNADQRLDLENRAYYMYLVLWFGLLLS
jgi:hypothetical protein